MDGDQVTVGVGVVLIMAGEMAMVEEDEGVRSLLGLPDCFCKCRFPTPIPNLPGN